MNNPTDNFNKVGFLRLVILIVALNIIVQFVHEGGHWAVYQVNERDPVWGFTSLVQIWETPPTNPDDWVTMTTPEGVQGWLRLSSLTESSTEEFIASAAGPIASLLGVIFGLLIYRSTNEPATKYVGLQFALLGAVIMSMYYLRSPMRSSGDEYWMALELGIPKYLVDIPLGLAFLTCLSIGMKQLGNWKIRLKWFGAFVIGAFPLGFALNQANIIVRTQVDLGNSLFNPVFGISFPVIVVNVLGVIGVWVWWRWVRNNVLSSSMTSADEMETG